MSNNCTHARCWDHPECLRPKKPKKIYRIPKMSAKRKKESRVYKKIVVEMARKDDECELKSPVCTGVMNGLDHTQKRSPKNYINKNNLKRACNACNGFKETSEGQKWAKENGHHVSRFKRIETKVNKKNMGRILVACEESQEVCKAFRALGHDAYSCDLQDCSGGHPEWHLKGDVVHQLYNKWDLVIAHPPCTRLANSGVRWLNERDLWQEMYYACEFFNQFQTYALNGTPVCIENPIPHKYAVEYIGKYTQIIQPWQFGHGESKATCLWLYNLPELKPTDIVKEREQKVWRMAPGPERQKMRSKTYPGIAKAFANQWSVVLESKNKEVA